MTAETMPEGHAVAADGWSASHWATQLADALDLDLSEVKDAVKRATEGDSVNLEDLEPLLGLVPGTFREALQYVRAMKGGETVS